MYLRIKDGTIVVTCNRLFNKKQIENFIIKKQNRILKILDIKDERIPLYNQENMLIFGENLRVNYETSSKKNSYAIYDDLINIFFKKDSFDNKYIEKVYQELLLIKIKEIYLEEKPKIEKYFDVSNITFKTQLMKSRFGSCIAKKRVVKLNSILARFSEKYVRTIIVHELIHLKEQNHQKSFYVYIDELIPNYRIMIRELNQLTRKYVI
jgi:hypothetical protein